MNDLRLGGHLRLNNNINFERSTAYMKEYTAKALSFNKYALGESPFYDPRYNRYSWVDIINNRLYTLKAGEKSCFTFTEPIGAAIPVEGSENFIIAAQKGLYILNSNDEISLYKNLTDIFKAYWRCNDAKADDLGRIWFGASVADDKHDAEGNLYCYKNNNFEIMQPGTKISNGMAWNKDQNAFYFSDSLEHAVFRYDYNKEKCVITNRIVLFPVENGVPDGMCIDADDNIWVAIWGGHRIEKRDGKTGELLAIIHVPATNVTSCCFGPDLHTLFITTSGNDLHGEFDGCLFECIVEEKGIIANYAKI